MVGSMNFGEGLIVAKFAESIFDFRFEFWL
jgi:hypothetical protein